MRHLTVKQKRLVREWVEANASSLGFHIDVTELPDDLYEELKEINDTEILESEISRYASDHLSEITDQSYSPFKYSSGESKANERN